MVGWEARSLWRSPRRLRYCGEGGECAKGQWRQACKDRQDRKGGGTAGARRRYPCGALEASSSLVTRDALELLICVGKGHEATESNVTPPTESPTEESPGLTLLTKLIFFGVIIGVVLSFLKTRKPTVEKSLA